MTSAETYDVVIVGGGTAGAVLAARLTEDADRSVCLIEGGPSDLGDDRVLRLRNWINLLGTELDYDYPTTPQPLGNSNIRHSRARVLGGCSSHNTMISFLPQPADFADWEAAGATGWGYEAMFPYYQRLLNNIEPVAEKDRNPIAKDFVTTVTSALGVPEISDFNAKPFEEGVGFFSVGYDPETGIRSSSSVAYLHPILDRPNLTLHLETWVEKLLVTDGRATGVRVRRPDGSVEVIAARGEVALCAGSIDTPRLLLLSGIGPADQLRELGIDVVADVPGVGENLLDHPESIIIWETKGPLPPESAMDSDAGLFVRRDPADPRPDLMFHFYQIPFCENTAPLGYPVPEHGVCMTPNIPRPRSTGRLYLISADPAVKPALDFRYFTDPEGYDAQTLVDGIRLAREVARAAPLSDWLLREVAPGPDVTDDEELSEYARRAAFTVFHPAGTCRMGDASDELAVVDPELRLRGVAGVRIADASVFPSMPTVNPMVAVLMIGEKAAALMEGPTT
jgi:choline dehydrogenase